MKVLVTSIVGTVLTLSIAAQKILNQDLKPVTVADFQLPKSNLIDSNTNAVILADIGSVSFVGNRRGRFSQVFERHTRIRIINEKAFRLATVRIVLYKEDNDVEKIEDVRAETFNLENGRVVETKMEKQDFFQEALDKNHVEEKFTMTGVRAGAIIDYAVLIRSDFTFEMPPWEFQHVDYPCLWSEFRAVVPNLLIYVAANQGVHPFLIQEVKKGQEHYTMTDPAGTFYADQSQDLNITAVTNNYRYVMKDVPAFKIENFLTSYKNYIDKIEFQLAKTSGDGKQYTDVLSDWIKNSQELMGRDDFGALLHDNNSFADNDLQNLAKNCSNKLQLARAIYYFVKNRMTCTYDGSFFMTASLKNIFQRRTGNVADVNLLLTALLEKAGVRCDPVLLSTRPHGFNFFNYPIWSKYNYVICKAEIDGSHYLLDASQPGLGFGQLDPICYNGRARVINGRADELELNADSLVDRKTTMIYLRNGPDGNLTGSVHQVFGYNDSYAIRDKIKKNGASAFWNDIKKDFSDDVDISNPQFDSLENLEQPLSISFELHLRPDRKDAVCYLTPAMTKAQKVNPLKSGERAYPVELPCAVDETYLLTLEVPEGYVVDEMPKQVSEKLNPKDDVEFDYLIGQSGKLISMKSRIRIGRTLYHPEEYGQLREFFNVIVKKFNDQIVFKKKSEP